MLVANLAQALQIALGRQQHAGGAGHRLDHHRGDVRGIMQGHQTLELVGDFGAMFRLPFGKRVALEVVRMRHVVDPRQHDIAESLAITRNAAHAHAAEIHAVIAAFATDETGAARITAGAVVGDRDLQCGVGRLGAGVGEENPVQARRRDGSQAAGGLEGQRVAHLERGREIQARDLFLHRLDDFLAAMPGRHAPQAGATIENFAPVRCLVEHALRFGQQAWRLLELAVGGVRHPEGRKILLKVGHVHGKFSLVEVPQY